MTESVASGGPPSQRRHFRATQIRACQECRRRKIRCDRDEPCSYCVRLGLRCAYTYTATSKQHVRDNTDSQLQTRGRIVRLQQALERIESLLSAVKSDLKELSSSETYSRLPGVGQDSQDIETNAQRSPSHAAETGQLVKAGASPVYVNDGVWVDLEYEQDSVVDPKETCPVPRPALEDAFIFGYSQPNADPLALMPSPHHHALFWQLYLETVDPVLKIFHAPTFQGPFLKAAQNPFSLTPSLRCLLHAIYYAAVVSLQSEEKCLELFQDQRQSLLDKYCDAFQTTLAEAKFLTCPDVAILQAMAIFLICARRDRNRSSVWALTALLIRLSRKIGLHRDPEAFNLSCFDSEMRRRLWWHICILDVRTAEDENMEPSIYEHDFDTRFPAYINDSDLHPSMSRLPAGEPKGTDMLFCLSRFEISYALRQVNFSDKFCSDNNYQVTSAVQKLSFINSISGKLEETYFQHCDARLPICFLSATASKLILDKTKLLIHLSSRQHGVEVDIHHSHLFFKTAIEIVEFTHSLRSHEPYQQWTFLFQKYIDWDSLAYLLLHLRSNPKTALAPRAWNAVNQCFQDWESDSADPSQENRWRRLQALRLQAATAQENVHNEPDAIANERPSSAILGFRDRLADRPGSMSWYKSSEVQNGWSKIQASTPNMQPELVPTNSTAIGVDPLVGDSGVLYEDQTVGQSANLQDMWWDLPFDNDGFNSMV